MFFGSGAEILESPQGAVDLPSERFASRNEGRKMIQKVSVKGMRFLNFSPAFGSGFYPERVGAFILSWCVTERN
jgi:hypothetical protein